MGNEESGADESFAGDLLEYPQYTRPAEFRGHEVPEVLRSGDHARIARWRRAQALRRTLDRRPDLLRGRALTADEAALLEEFRRRRRLRLRRIPGLTSTFPDDGAPFP